MGDSIIYKLKSGKPNKFLNFLSGFAGLAIPDAFFRQRLQGLLAQAPKHPDYDYIRKRVDYYIKTNQPFHVSDTNRLTRERSWIYYTGRIGDYTRKMFHTAYFFDQHDVTRWFPKCFRWNFCPGDVYFTPDTPTVVKSRLLTGDNSNSVILKLDKLRHFMFVHDTHSHLNSFSTVVDEKQEMIGGFARIKTLIDEQKEKDPDTLVVDGGDFSMGTLVQTVFETQAAEIRMLGALGCEATTLGNHEFDYRSKGLAKMLETAAESGDTVPELLVCNINWDAMEQQGFSEGQQQIRDAFTEYGVKDYVMVQKGDVRVALLGVFRKDALACAPTCELQFTDPVEAVKKTVAEIKKNEDADIIVCLSHSGTSEDESKSEDEILAKKVPDLDVIVSAHTHTKLDEPIVHGDTYIVSAGEYGKYLGSLSLEQKDDGRWNMKEYKLTPIETDIAENAATQEEINSFMATVDTDYLAQFGFTREQVLAENDVAFDSLEDLYNIHTEHNLGDLIADAYAYAVTNSTDYNGTPVADLLAGNGGDRAEWNDP